jgi:fatty acid desaturase
MIGKILRNATGSVVPEDQHFIPESEKAKVVRSSRAYVAIFAAVIGSCVAFGSLLPAMLIVLPRFYGGPLAQIFNITQHAGLDEDVYDHRLNTRTITMNPLFSFLYANMNYHIEHHMFPMVPFYALPQLHEMIKHQCPPAYPSLWAAYQDIVPALLRQRKDPAYFIRRELPGVAQPMLKAA